MIFQVKDMTAYLHSFEWNESIGCSGKIQIEISLFRWTRRDIQRYVHSTTSRDAISGNHSSSLSLAFSLFLPSLLYHEHTVSSDTLPVDRESH